MTDNQRVFADEYIKSRNATQSYLKAYPNASRKTAGANGHRLLKNTEISEYIDSQHEIMHSEIIADASEIMEFYTAMMRGEIRDEQPVFVGGGVQEIQEIRSKCSDRIKAADLLAKMLGVESGISTAKLKLEQERAKRDAERLEAEKSPGIIAEILKAVDSIE